MSDQSYAAISSESPFIPKGGQQALAATENSPIEFRGVISTAEGLTFGIYEPATQKGSWVTEGEKTQAFVVRSYDASKAAVTVEYQGQVQTLVLKEAKFEGTVAPTSAPPPPVAGMAQTRPANSSIPQPSMNQADEAKRLETVAAEVRRRRAARQAANQSGAQPAPAQPAQPGR